MSKYGHSALKYSSCALNVYPAMYVIFCVAEKNGSFPSFFFPNKRRKLCFVINVLNNKTIILLNLAEYRLILANSSNGLVG